MVCLRQKIYGKSSFREATSLEGLSEQHEKEKEELTFERIDNTHSFKRNNHLKKNTQKSKELIAYTNVVENGGT